MINKGGGGGNVEEIAKIDHQQYEIKRIEVILIKKYFFQDL